MIIRREQQESFAGIRKANFENNAVDHIREFAPRHAEVLGEEGTRRAVRAGIERAAAYGFTSRGPVQIFLDLMFLLGSKFDADPQYPWAGQVLVDPAIPGQAPRADRLYARSMQYLDRVLGPDNRFAIEALRRMKFLPRPNLADVRVDAGRTVTALQSVYPQKAEYLGPDVLRALAERSAGRARNRGISMAAGFALFAGLEFAVGCAFEADPLYPWIESALVDPLIQKPEDRVSRLYDKTMVYLDHAVAYLEKK